MAARMRLYKVGNEYVSARSGRVLYGRFETRTNAAGVEMIYKDGRLYGYLTTPKTVKEKRTLALSYKRVSQSPEWRKRGLNERSRREYNRTADVADYKLLSKEEFALNSYAAGLNEMVERGKLTASEAEALMAEFKDASRFKRSGMWNELKRLDREKGHPYFTK